MGPAGGRRRAWGTIETMRSAKNDIRSVRAIGLAAALGTALLAAPAAASAQGDAPVELQVKEIVSLAKELYRSGAADAALTKLAEIDRLALPDSHPLVRVAANTATAIEQVRDDFHDGVNAYNRGAVSRALKAWDRVLATDQNVVGDKPSLYAERISRFWAREAAFKAEQYFQEEKYEDAYALWKRVESVDRDSQAARMGFAKLEEAAEQLYKDGYALQEINVDESIERWQRVLAILPPSHPLYKKTKSRLLKIP